MPTRVVATLEYTVLSLEMLHHMGMSEIGRHGYRVLRSATAIFLAFLLVAPVATFSSAQTTDKISDDHFYEPLPQETGAAGLKLMLRRLQTTGRLMQVVAHPDDEDGGMLTLESRGKGVSTLLMTLTRGEGGQNKLGSNLFDVLGVLRTLELLASDRYYGVEQRFSRVADFGYSKTAEETFQKWQGHDVALGDMVRVIRTVRPDVLVARFSGTDRDGHGHHQASAILTREAFRAAADPKRFPEQIAEGLQPWQAKKLYTGNVCGFFSPTCDAANYTVRLNTGANDPVLGTSYIQFAMKGLRHQLSQGSGTWTVEPGDRFTHYKLLDSVVDSPKDKDGHEKDFFDGIDTTLPGLASRLGDEEKKVPWLRTELESVRKHIEEASAAAQHEPYSATDPLLAAYKENLAITKKLFASQLSKNAKESLLVALGDQGGALSSALALAIGAKLDIAVDGISSDQDHVFLAVPGQMFHGTATVNSEHRWADKIQIELAAFPAGWKITRLADDRSSGGSVARFTATVPNNIPYTRPYWHRSNPETDAINIIDAPSPHDVGLPFAGTPWLGGQADLRRGDVGFAAYATCSVKYKDARGNVAERPLAVVPQFSVGLEPGGQVVPTSDGNEMTVKVGVSSSLPGSTPGTLRLELPAGWKSEPRELAVNLPDGGDKKDFEFKIIPTSLKEGRTEVRAVLEAGGKKYAEGYTLVTREDLGAAYYYQPAMQRVSIVDVKVPKNLRVGYIMGAGDEIPTVLQQIGMKVTLIAAEKLGTEDLSKYQTIVLGIRTYDNQKDVIAHNKRLLEFVEAGGRLVVQYNASASDFNAGKFTPYPLTLSRARVSVEEAPVTILDPANQIFHSPNEITQKDFEGWVQERGLYFASQWDPKFTPLLETHDPGESEQKGGLLVAHYGKGTYIYTGYAFFRQLPAGVPGAVRLFVNLVSE